jgi:hypothetical protein
MFYVTPRKVRQNADGGSGQFVTTMHRGAEARNIVESVEHPAQ